MAVSVGAGLSALEAGRGTLIAFSDRAEQGCARWERPEIRRSTQALLKHIRTPGLDIAFIMRPRDRGSRDRGGGKQVPWMRAAGDQIVVLARWARRHLGCSPPAPAGGSGTPTEIAWSF